MKFCQLVKLLIFSLFNVHVYIYPYMYVLLALLMMQSSQLKSETKMEFPGKTYVVPGYHVHVHFDVFSWRSSKSILPDTAACSLGQCVWFRLPFVCMHLQRLLFDLYVMIPGQICLDTLSISFSTSIQRHKFACFLLGKRDWFWILFSLPPMSCEH